MTAPPDDDAIDDVFIRAARELLRWDQARLAAALGKHATMVRRLETGRQVPSGLRAEAVARLREAGVVFLPPGRVDGIDTLGGVALAVDNAMGERKRYKVAARQDAPPGAGPKKP